jgi:hypothetical protein
MPHLMKSLFNATAIALVLAATLGCGAHVSTSPGTRPPGSTASELERAHAWDEFWRARKVVPAPPQTVLDGDPSPPPEILNLTNGHLGDEVVRKWAMAALRRGRGDGWAAHHLRLDVVNADVFGPPGLNGSDEAIASERAKGTREIRCRPGTVVAVGVVAVPRETRERIAEAGLTEFVVVEMYRASGEPCERVHADGTTAVRPSRRARGELSWQLDTGDFRDDPVVGPLWYQAHGWSCNTEEKGMVDEICALVHPSPPAVVCTPACPPRTTSRNETQSTATPDDSVPEECRLDVSKEVGEEGRELVQRWAATCKPLNRCLLACIASKCGVNVGGGCAHLCIGDPSEAVVLHAAKHYLDVLHNGAPCFP